MKICLCGSTRFMDQFHEANVLLSLAGHVVYSVATSTKGEFQPTEDQKLMLDAVHLSKIEESDAVMIVGVQPDGSLYIGESTRREIAFARAREKDLYFFSPGLEIAGPLQKFNDDIREASTTREQRDERRREQEAAVEARRAQFLAHLGTSQDGTIEDEDVDHTDDPEAPVKEETH
jgi:hypothetical protein